MLGPNATLRDLYDPAMLVQTEAEAEEYLRMLIDWSVKYQGCMPLMAHTIQMMNIGWWVDNNYGGETSERVRRLFGNNTSNDPDAVRDLVALIKRSADAPAWSEEESNA